MQVHTEKAAFRASNLSLKLSTDQEVFYPLEVDLGLLVSCVYSPQEVDISTRNTRRVLETFLARFV